MFAMLIKKDKNLSWEQVPDPTIRKGEALINVKAAGVNRADILQLKGLYLPPEGASKILGLELSGEIVEIKSSEWEIGDRVMVLVTGGAYATEAVVPIDMLLPIPSNFSFEEAATIPEAIYTSYLNLVVEGKLQKGETVLIHSGAGGVGSTAIQLAKSLGATVIATCGSEEKIKFCKSVGADVVVNYKEVNLENKLKEIHPEGYDLVFDTIGGEYTNLHVNLLKTNGRWILIGLLGGIEAKIDFSKFLTKNILLKSSTLRNKPLSFKVNLTNQIKKNILPLYNTGKIRPVVDKIYPIEKAEEAHKFMEENRVKGKIVLKI